jgi:hypothetical protein
MPRVPLKSPVASFLIPPMEFVPTQDSLDAHAQQGSIYFMEQST